jgi:hypothetical protein
MEGQGAILAPASKVRAIHGRFGSPREISVALGGGGGAGASVAVAVGSAVAVGVGGAVAVHVGVGTAVGVTVEVAVGRSVGVGVSGRNWDITGTCANADESQAAVSSSRQSEKSSKGLGFFKVQSLLNGAYYVAIGQVLIEIVPRTRCGGVVTMAVDHLRRNRILVA